MRNNFLGILILFFILISCNSEILMNKENNLINESSPYLLQHAKILLIESWDKKYLNIAEKQNKLVIISIGYASCHWCHVMERESFKIVQLQS